MPTTYLQQGAGWDENTSHGSTTTLQGSFDLSLLAAKQPEWRDLSAQDKLGYINAILDAIAKDGPDGFIEMANKNLQMTGMSPKTPEGQAQAAETAFFSCMSIKQTLCGLKQAYELRAGISKHQNKLTNLFTKKSINGQVIAQILPGDPASKINPFAKNNSGEIWFDPMYVKSTSDIQPFNFEFFDKKSDGICVVLGAGNWDFLAVNDVLQGLFFRNQVVFLKHHPLRGASLDPLIRKILAPVLQKGFFQAEVDKGAERCSEVVYSPYVSTVHLTGGKAAHDAIVWGEPHEQAKRKAESDPKLKAEMSAELGAVTPWIVPPAQYSDEELNHQACSVASAIFNNSSCNCNAPKIVIISKAWKQGEKFKELVCEHFSKFETPCSYYPGSKTRWEATRDNMKRVKITESVRGLSVQDRNLKTPMFGKDGPVTLPLLSTDVDVELSTEDGRNEAKTTYAFQNEPFAPTICFASITDDNGNLDTFLDRAVTLSNDYCFGTLSCSLTVPPSLEGTDSIEKAIAALQYGDVTLNGWSAIGFVTGLPWGGFPAKERKLDAIQTGASKIFNAYFLPHVEKSVVRTPIIADNHVIKPVEFPKPQENIDAVKYFASATV